MYRRFYGISDHPFDLTPDPRYLYLTPKHREALAHLEYGLAQRKGITVLIGEVGTGKTILLRTALARARKTAVHCAKIWNPTLTRTEFYELLAAQFGLTAAAAGSKARFLIELEGIARRQHDAGGVTALVVDEAQSLPIELLEEIRLLANIESDTQKLLQVVLVGQPELNERLHQTELRQLKQRVALRCVLGPLDLPETAAYIAGRIRIAGGEPGRIFSRDAVAEIYERSRGIPRLVSVICDNALVTGFALGARPIDRRIVLDVCHDLDFRIADADSAIAHGTEPDTPETNEPTIGTPTEAADIPSTSVESDPVTDAPVVARRFAWFGAARPGGRR